MVEKKTANIEEIKEVMETGGVDEVHFDEDVAEIVDVYGQVEEMLASQKLSSKPTSEDIRALTATVFIQRADAKRAKAGAATPKPWSGAKSGGFAKKTTVEVSECPLCRENGKENKNIHHVSKNNKPYMACKICRVWIDRDGSTRPMGE